MNYRWLTASLSALLVGIVFTVSVAAAGTVTIKSRVVNHAMESLTISCPAADGQPAITVTLDSLLDSMNEAEMDQLVELIAQFESQNSVLVESTTDSQGNDVISSESNGPDTGVGQQLCDLVRLHSSGSGAESAVSAAGAAPGGPATGADSAEDIRDATTPTGARAAAPVPAPTSAGTRPATGIAEGVARGPRPTGTGRGPGSRLGMPVGPSRPDTSTGEVVAEPDEDDGKVVITSFAEDGVYVSGKIKCPVIGRSEAFEVDIGMLLARMSEREAARLRQLIRNFENGNGVDSESETTRGPDDLRTDSSGPPSGTGRQICNLIRRYA